MPTFIIPQIFNGGLGVSEIADVDLSQFIIQVPTQKHLRPPLRNLN